MTTIITRAYGDRGKADAAAKALKTAGFLPEMMDVLDAGEGLKGAMIKAEVTDEVAAAYAKKLNEGQAVLVARVPFFPIGAAKTAMEIADRQKPLKVEVPKRDVYVRKDEKARKRELSVDTDHKLVLSGGKPPGNAISHGHWATRIVPYPLLSDRKPPANTIQNRAWAGFFPHLSTRKPPENAIDRGGHWATRIIPYPLLSDRKPPENAIDRRGHWSTRILDVPLIISR